MAFGWSDGDLKRFFVHGRERGVEHEGESLRAQGRFTYEYDRGDSWVHDVHLEASRLLDPERSYPLCIGGRRAAPAAST